MRLGTPENATPWSHPAARCSGSFLFANDGVSVPEAAPMDPKTQLAALPYSSGTTGLPKGVMLSHYNLVANSLQSTRHPVIHTGLQSDDVLIGV